MAFMVVMSGFGPRSSTGTMNSGCSGRIMQTLWNERAMDFRNSRCHFFHYLAARPLLKK